MSIKPATTRLRFVSAKKPEQITEFLSKIGTRVFIQGAPIWDGKVWTLWFIPPDDISIDVKNTKL